MDVAFFRGEGGVHGIRKIPNGCYTTIFEPHRQERAVQGEMASATLTKVDKTASFRLGILLFAAPRCFCSPHIPVYRLIHAFRRIPFFLLFPHRFWRALVLARQYCPEGVAPGLQLFLLRRFFCWDGSL